MVLEVSGRELPLLGVVALGVTVGLVAGLFGVGGSFLLTPLLSVVFRVPLPIAIGSGLCQMVGTSVVALLRHRDLGHGEPRIGVLMLAGSLVGVAAGARAVSWLGEAGHVVVRGRTLPVGVFVLDAVFVVFLTLVALTVWKQGGPVEPLDYVRRGPLARVRLGPSIDLPSVPLSGVSAILVAYIGLGLGLLSGLLGVGGGLALVPVLLYGFGLPIRHAAGTGIVVLLVASALGTVIHATQGHVHLGLAMVLLVGSSVSAQAGALLSDRLPARILRRLLALLILGTVIAIVADVVRRLDASPAAVE